MTKPALPLVRGTGNAELDRFCQNAKQTLDGMTGQAKNSPRLQPLATDATAPELVARLNALLNLLQG